MKPPLILADEPTGNLDAHTGKVVMDLLFRLCAENQTALVLITHDLTLASRFARQVHLVDGQIVPHEIRHALPEAAVGITS